MSIIKMTVAQYANERGIGSSAVRKAIILGHAMPGVIKREKFGNAHVLYVDKKNIKEISCRYRKSYLVLNSQTLFMHYVATFEDIDGIKFDIIFDCSNLIDATIEATTYAEENYLELLLVEPKN